jgi:hypothetical protein
MGRHLNLWGYQFTVLRNPQTRKKKTDPADNVLNTVAKKTVWREINKIWQKTAQELATLGDEIAKYWIYINDAIFEAQMETLIRI